MKKRQTEASNNRIEFFKKGIEPFLIIPYKTYIIASFKIGIEPIT